MRSFNELMVRNPSPHMRLYSNSGVVRPRLLIGVAVLFAAALVTVLFLRPTKNAPHAEAPALELSQTNLVFEGGRWRQPGSTNPFTGLMLEHYADGTLRSRSAVVNGLLNGLSEGFYTNTARQVAEYFKDSVSHGLRTKWYPDGARQSEAHIADGKLHGTFRKWHENGILSERAKFVGGQPEGVSLAYFPSGEKKARVVMRNGKPVEREFWKEGRKAALAPSPTTPFLQQR